MKSIKNTNHRCFSASPLGLGGIAQARSVMACLICVGSLVQKTPVRQSEDTEFI